VLPDQLEHLQSAAQVAGVDIVAGSAPRVRDVVADRVRLAVLEWGPTDGPTIVFLHGGSLTAHTWDLVCASLSDRYRCLAVDLRGHGDSEWPADADYRLPAFANDIVAFIAQETSAPPLLVGMSLGGLTAIRVAGAGGVSLAGLVIVDVGPNLRLDGAERIVEFTRTDQVMGGVEDFVNKAMVFNPRRRPELLRRSLLHNLRPLPSGHWTWKWDPRRVNNYDLTELARDHAELWEVVPDISCPTLVVRGDRSNVFLAEDQERLTAALGDARSAVVEDAGHTVQGDNPRGFLTVLRPFLDEVLPV
jgi:pimeloyl-ACP methyl ester carboxylesterase